MMYIGTVPPKVWDIALQIARRDAIPMPQPEDSPYITLKQINNNQLLILSGVFRKQAIDVNIVPISTPGLKDKDSVPIEERDWEIAREDSLKLLTKAVEEHAT